MCVFLLYLQLYTHYIMTHITKSHTYLVYTFVINTISTFAKYSSVSVSITVQHLDGGTSIGTSTLKLKLGPNLSLKFLQYVAMHFLL